MAKIEGSYPYVSQLNGVFERKHKGDTAIVARTVYGQTIACKVTYSDKNPTANQLALRARFATAASKAADDMLDPDKKAEWHEIAMASHGKWKTARGAAFASYYADEE
jgi:hypothetical protein